MTSHDELRRLLGSYVLGALDPSERAQLEAHLASCPNCREELASYAGLPGLLSRLSLQEATESALLPPPSLLPRVLAAVDHERARGVRRLHRWQAATAALCVAALVTFLVAALPRAVGPQPSRQSLVASSGVSASGQVTLEPRPWGTAVHLRLQTLPAAPAYTAWTVDAAGVRSAVATWGPTGDGRAEVTGATALEQDAVRSLIVSTADGRDLLSVSR